MPLHLPLNKEIFKTLLSYFLDIRLKRYWARSLWMESSSSYHLQDRYSLTDQLGSNFSAAIFQLVEDRLKALSNEKKENLDAVFEKTQLLVWKIFVTLEKNDQSCFEEISFEQDLSSMMFELKRLQKILKKWRYRFLKKQFKNHVDFFTERLMDELSHDKSDHSILKKGGVWTVKATSFLDKAFKALEKGNLDIAYQDVRKALSYKPYSLTCQIIELFVFLLVRFERAFQKLEKASSFSQISYKVLLIQRADQSLKKICQLLRIFYLENRLPLGWHERLQVRVEANWKSMIQILDREMSSLSQKEELYWQLWSQACLYRLGLGYSGQIDFFKNVDQARLWLEINHSTEKLALKLVVSLLIFIDEALQNDQVKAETINKIGAALESIGEKIPSLTPSILRSLQDLNLLYTRQDPILRNPVLKASGRLLSISFELDDSQTFVICLQCLEDLYDIWSGSCELN